MLKSSLCDYSDAFILASETISVANTEVQDTDVNNNNIKVALKNCAPFTDSISEINDTQVDNTKDIDVVMLMHNLIKYSNDFYGNTIEMNHL